GRLRFLAPTRTRSSSVRAAWWRAMTSFSFSALDLASAGEEAERRLDGAACDAGAGCRSTSCARAGAVRITIVNGTSAKWAHRCMDSSVAGWSGQDRADGRWDRP